MKGAYKKFDKKLFKENDKIAKQLTIKLIKSVFDLNAVENLDEYGVDLCIVMENEVVAYVESEIKMVWDTVNFPYKTVQFPERKAKFARLEKPTLFCMINGLKNRAITVWDMDLLASPLIEVPNRYNPTGELFYQVPLEKVKFYNI
jgi:hypothetical protein